MKRRSLLAACLAVSMSGCALAPAQPPAPVLPPNVFGLNQDNDVGAINTAAWDFASPERMRGNPAEAARAVVALEYLSGELVENPRWFSMDGSIKRQMGEARDRLRAILGIPLQAPPQAVVNTLLALGRALAAGNQAGALRILAAPVFTFPPEKTLAILSNLPAVPIANRATSRASLAVSGVMGSRN